MISSLLTNYSNTSLTIIITYLEKLAQGALHPFYYIFMYKYKLHTKQSTWMWLRTQPIAFKPNTDIKIKYTNSVFTIIKSRSIKKDVMYKMSLFTVVIHFFLNAKIPKIREAQCVANSMLYIWGTNNGKLKEGAFNDKSTLPNSGQN